MFDYLYRRHSQVLCNSIMLLLFTKSYCIHCMCLASLTVSHVSPFLWYFYSALPRACLIGVPLAVWGVIKERRTWPMISASLIFVLVYSLLPHKELRFIIYTIPLLNVTAAAGLTNLLVIKSKLSWQTCVNSIYS